MRPFRLTLISSLILMGCSGAEVDEPSRSVEQRLVDAEILGFEDPSLWTVSAGTKGSSTDRTEGDASLSLSGFSYAELSSAALSDFGTPTASLSLDVKVPVSPEWGQVALVVDSPSVGVYSAYLGQVPLAGSVADAWRTVGFEVPGSIVSALALGPSDLTFKVVLNVPYTTQAYLVDNLRFDGGSTEATVTLNVSDVDDFVYLTVNGVRRKVFPWHTGVLDLDVSSWFFAGTNTVRIHQIDFGGDSSYDVEFLVNGVPAVQATCLSSPCDSLPGGVGIHFDGTYVFNVGQLPEPATLDVNGTAGGKIYIDDAYTGFSVPHTFTLPAGSYQIGVGVGEGSPGAYAGTFYEQTVVLAPSDSVTVTPSSGSPVPPNVTTIAIVPVRTTYHGDTNPENTGVLTANDISVMYGQAVATRDQFVEPFSYGLLTWDVDLLPVVEDTPLYRDTASDAAPRVDEFLTAANLKHLEEEYDIVLVYYSNDTAAGIGVVNSPCCWWAHPWNKISFHNATARWAGWDEDRPNVYLLHEALHNYEWSNQHGYRFYNGVGQTHGSGEHGYTYGANGEEDFVLYYRRFMRNQVAEVVTMREGSTWTNPIPSDADLWVGVFDTMRNGMSKWWSNSNLAPAAAAAAAAATRTLAPAGNPPPACALPTPPAP